MLNEETKRLLAYYLNLPLVPPRIINFGMTNRCNYSCNICRTKQETTKSEEELSPSVIRKTIRDIASWNREGDHDIKISFAGGEPLLKKEEVLEAIELATRLGISTHLTTNGSLVDEDTAELLIDSGLSSISVSLDGSSAPINNRMREEESFDDIVKGIKDLINVKEEKEAEITVSTVTVITQQNLKDLVRIYRFVKKLGVDHANFNPYALDNSFMNKGNYEEDPFWIPKEKGPALQKAVADLKAIKREKNDIDTPKSVLKNLESYFRLQEDFNRGKCLAGHSYMHIKPNGEVDVCGKGPSFSCRPMNVKDKNIKRIWHSFNFFVTRLRIARCQRPCLMLCFDRSERDLRREIKDFLVSKLGG